MRPIDRVLERVRDARAQDVYYKARCPAHDDREPSLSISEGEDGRVLLKCFAGCEVDAIVAYLGLRMSDLFDDADGGGRYYPSRNGAPAQHLPRKPHGTAPNTVAGADATPDNGATPP